MVWILALTIIAMPLMRDVFTKEFLLNNSWVIYLNIIMMYSFNPKLFSPFVNYVLNNKMPPQDRTSINSVSFITSTLTSSILINIFGPVYSMTFSSPFFLKFYPYNKYFIFVCLFIILLMGQAFMVPIVFKKKAN